MKLILLPILAATALVVSCSEWTDPRNVDFLPRMTTYDPAALADLRAFKASEHPLLMMHVEGTPSAPNRQNQHPMAMPDSVDFLLMSRVDGLHASLVAEVAEVRAAKGTRTLNLVSYDAIRSNWEALRAEAVEAGRADEYSETKFADYCRTETRKQLEYCVTYGLDGVVASYLGGYDAEPAAPFVLAVDAWANEHADKLLFLRGYPSYVARIEGQTLVLRCNYLIILAEDARASVSISRMVREQLTEGVPTDRVILETSVPVLADGGGDPLSDAAVRTAAEWVMDPRTSSTVRCDKRGLCISNAPDDYFNKPTYRRIREALAILNPAADESNSEN
ncbi:glycoside hydrolase family 18 [Alistipes sp.]|uniref:glycoside hydrolase family 18 n=1 Tax=Alistipes sp. TaxID=1872444 RepID=UPI003A890FFA